METAQPQRSLKRTAQVSEISSRRASACSPVLTGMSTRQVRPASRYRIALVRQKFRFDGGGERIVGQIKTILEEQGHNITLITRDWSEGAAQVLPCRPRYWGRVQREACFARRAMQLARQHTFDLIQSHERIPGSSVYRAGDGVHRVWLEQRARTLSPLAARLLFWNRYHRYVLQAEKELYEHPQLRAVICNSRMVQQEIATRFAIDPAKLHLIYNGVDLEKFHPREKIQRESVREQWQIPQTAPTFLFVGSGWERKGLLRLLQALTQTPQAHLLIVGRDKAHKSFEKFCQQHRLTERVHFAGVQPDVVPFYAAADAFVLPTLYDPFPNAVMEAMASGLPVVTSQQCGGAEWIQSGENGYVCDALDVAQLAEFLHRLTELALAQRMGIQARRTVEPYSLSAMNGQLTSLYQSLLSGA